jgi:hypothetical protein
LKKAHSNAGNYLQLFHCLLFSALESSNYRIVNKMYVHGTAVALATSQRAKIFAAQNELRGLN